MDTTITTPIGTAHVIARYDTAVYCKHYADETNEAHRPAKPALDGHGRGYFWRLWDNDQVKKESEK